MARSVKRLPCDHKDLSLRPRTYLKKKNPNTGVLACNPRAERWRQANSWGLLASQLGSTSPGSERNSVSKNQIVPYRMAAKAVLWPPCAHV